jgi:hypothetical protein
MLAAENQNLGVIELLSDSDRVKMIVDTLSKEIESYTPWASRKEIAAWTAIAFYLAIVWLFLDFILKISSENFNFFNFFLEVLPLYAVLIVISMIFLIFIHSQFSSIYDKQAKTNAIRNTIFKILNNEIKPMDLKIDVEKNILELMINELEDQVGRIRFKEGIHPLNVLIDLWSFRWIRKTEGKKYNTHARQEAAIYSLVLVSYGIMSIFLTKIFFAALF